MSGASTFSSICFERGCWFKGERKRLTLGSSNVASPSSMRVSASSSAKPEKDIRIGLLGASGYTGAEIVRLLANHPHFGVTLMTADRKAGQGIKSPTF
uniref:Putative N-acetyl-gamma-glutamyl-phosphate reductase, chloroplastic n=1 Tax=Noccaea caerulescens TaxID=107243 RepID=A0A1J3J411_NOCCA